jgi:hypothetical protein
MRKSNFLWVILIALALVAAKPSSFTERSSPTLYDYIPHIGPAGAHGEYKTQIIDFLELLESPIPSFDLHADNLPATVQMKLAEGGFEDGDKAKLDAIPAGADDVGSEYDSSVKLDAKFAGKQNVLSEIDEADIANKLYAEIEGVTPRRLYYGVKAFLTADFGWYGPGVTSQPSAAFYGAPIHYAGYAACGTSDCDPFDMHTKLSYDGSYWCHVTSLSPYTCKAYYRDDGEWVNDGLILPAHATNDASLDELGKVFIDDTEDALAVHAGANGEVAGEVQVTMVPSRPYAFDPKAVCDGDTDILFLTWIGDDAPNGIIIDEWKTSFLTASPAAQLDADLCYADNLTTRANEVVIDAIDTSSGVSSEDTDANINSGNAVPNGKVMYIKINTAYAATGEQCTFQFWYHAEED